MRARRGDLVVFGEFGSSGAVGGVRCLNWRVERVTSVMRDGSVKATAVLPDGRPVPFDRRDVDLPIFLVQVGSVDVDAVTASVAAHTWPSGGPRPFDSLDEVRAVIARHRKN